MAIKVHGLKKTFRVGLRNKKIEAVRQVDLEVEPGEVFGFVGPNGAGKSTTIHMLLGLVKPDAGSGQILGADLGSVQSRKQLGYLPELPHFYGYLKASELLQTSARLAGIDEATIAREIPELLERVGLQKHRNSMLKTFSKGMLQRVGLAQAIMGSPKLVILDEPMSGLDPIGRHIVRQVIHDLRKNGSTVFFSSHVMPDVESLCDRICLMANGRSIKTGRVDELLKETQDRFSLQIQTNSELPKDFTDVLSAERVGHNLNIVMRSGPELEKLTQWAQAQGQLIALTPLRRDLESIVVETLEKQDSQEQAQEVSA